MLFTGIFATAFMYTLQNIGQRYLSEEKVTFTHLSEPIFANIAEIVVLGEKFSQEIFIGGSLILISMLIVSSNRKAREKIVFEVSQYKTKA